MKRGVIFGVFDLIHVGHVRVLEEAKKHCQHLTVYVINDEVAKSYKRETIIEEAQRLEMVRSLRMVDAAFLIDHRSPVDLEEMDHYFVSERLRKKKLYYAPQHRLKDVIYLPYFEAINTTAVIRRCRDGTLPGDTPFDD